MGEKALTLAGGVAEYQSQMALGAYQKSIYDTNARFADLQASDALKRGERSAIDIKRQGRQLIGSQRTALAAQGIELDNGTALDIQSDTADLSTRDAMTARNNAWREAWGFKAEAMNLKSAGNMESIAAKNRARNTLANAGIRVARQMDKESKFLAGGAA